MGVVNKLYGKIFFEGTIVLQSGMHIGGSSEFSAIGAVDSVVVKDTMTKLPIIPGSSLKGKMRYLLARVYTDNIQLKDIREEDVCIKRLFGASANGNEFYSSRLQFYDMIMNKESAEKIKNMEPDLYVTEIKFENTINRLTAIANPRQLERVPAGAEFDFRLVYNIEKEDELQEDIESIARSISLLQDDYLGGHGSRGYGRVSFVNINIDYKFYGSVNQQKVKEIVCNSFKI